jgi:hypothetical protein
LFTIAGFLYYSKNTATPHKPKAPRKPSKPGEPPFEEQPDQEK